MPVLARILANLGACALLALSPQLLAHDMSRPNDNARAVADFPAVGELQVLSVDLHTHSVFSDGHVWPTIRAEEAARDMLDAVAITEHLEWQPHIADIPHPDRNRSYNETVRGAKNLDVLIIPGIEITRQGDPGHINAVFIKDANSLVRASGIKDYVPAHLFASREEALATSQQQSAAFAGAHKVERPEGTRWAPFASREIYMTLVNYGVAVEQDAREVLDAAAAQGAFNFWNHPSFATTNAKATRFHRGAIKGGVLHGVEIANGDQYYPNAHRLALKHNLAFIGTSDVHQLIAWDYDREKNRHRPVTLVLARERSAEAIKAALFEHKTIVWWKQTLIGRKAELLPLLEASISLEGASKDGYGRTLLQLRNHSGADFRVAAVGEPRLANAAAPLILPANSVTNVSALVDGRKDVLKLEILNALVGVDEPAQLEFPFERQD